MNLLKGIMKKILIIILIFSLPVNSSFAQIEKEIQLEKVEIISSPRIEIPYLDNSINIVTISKEQIEKEIVLLNDNFKKYNIEKNNLLKDFKNIKKQKLDNFLKQINPLIHEYMKKNSIDIILDQRQIFIGNVNKDITEKILTIVNKKFPNNG